MSVARAMLSSDRDDWQTPHELLDRVSHYDRIALDPCAALDRRRWFAAWNANNVIAGRRDDRPDDQACADGLAIRWAEISDEHDGCVFFNPPYGRAIGDWAGKARDEAAAGATVIGLLPARTDTLWWHEHVLSAASAVCYWRGRITFVGAEQGAPFPSALPLWGGNVNRFRAAFCDVGFVQDLTRR